jgi:DNA-binding MarR family transcriptional regulator
MESQPAPVPCSGATLGLLFRQVRDAMWARMAEELDTLGHDLTFSQYMTLKKLADGTAGVTNLARAVDLNPGAMTRLLDRLEAKGLIARVADAGDRRALNIHLTDAGLAIWQDINQCGMRVRERAMHGMSEAEREQLMRLVTQARDNLSPSGS